jgi:hypothetical protein
MTRTKVKGCPSCMHPRIQPGVHPGKHSSVDGCRRIWRSALQLTQRRHAAAARAERHEVHRVPCRRLHRAARGRRAHGRGANQNTPWVLCPLPAELPSSCCCALGGSRAAAVSCTLTLHALWRACQETGLPSTTSFLLYLADVPEGEGECERPVRAWLICTRRG